MIELTGSLEDYLETIYLLQQRDGSVRITDIAKSLNFSKPSVSKAVNILKENGLLLQEKYGKINLTDKGIAFAEEIYFRHKSLLKFLIDDVGIDPQIAESEACKIEHDISKDSILKIISYANKIKTFKETYSEKK